MKNVLKFFGFFLMAIVLMTSCQKDNVDETINVSTDYPDPEVVVVNTLVGAMTMPGNGQGMELGCLTLNYPFDFLLDDGSTVTVNSDEEGWAAISDSANIVVDFVYPLTVTDPDGNTLTIEDNNALGEAFAACIPDDFGQEGFPVFCFNIEENCFELQYPVTVADADGNESTAADQEALVDLLATNPELFFVFPFNVVNADGEVTEVTDEFVLYNLMAECEGIIDGNPVDSSYTGGGVFACFDLQYPVIVTLEDGTTATADSEEAFVELLFSGNVTGFGYPLTLIDEEGNTTTVNSDEELQNALSDCPGFGGELSSGIELILSGQNCFEITFPIELFVQNQTIAVESYEDLMSLAGSGYDLVFPINATVTETGESIVFENEGDIIQALENCE